MKIPELEKYKEFYQLLKTIVDQTKEVTIEKGDIDNIDEAITKMKTWLKTESEEETQ